MDLDLAQVRAFVVTAEQLHFGRAAQQLFLSQQAVSKRVARLEAALGVRLLARDNKQAVALTDAGRRFLEPALRALAAADAAVAAARRDERPLRIDVWGHLYGPMRMVRPVLDEIDVLAGHRVDVGQARDMPAAVGALLREEIDAGFGRVPQDDPLLTAVLATRIVRLEPISAVLGAEHPLAGAEALRPSDLHGGTLWCPAGLDRLDFLRHFSERFGVRTDSGGPNLGIENLLDHVRTDTERFALLPAEVPLPADAGIRRVPLVDPGPRYAWSLLWRARDQHPLLDALRRGFAEIGARRGWLDADPGRDWFPETLRSPGKREIPEEPPTRDIRPGHPRTDVLGSPSPRPAG